MVQFSFWLRVVAIFLQCHSELVRGNAGEGGTLRSARISNSANALSTNADCHKKRAN